MSYLLFWVRFLALPLEIGLDGITHIHTPLHVKIRVGGMLLTSSVIIRSHILILGVDPTVKQYASQYDRNVGRVSHADVKCIPPTRTYVPGRHDSEDRGSTLGTIQYSSTTVLYYLDGTHAVLEYSTQVRGTEDGVLPGTPVLITVTRSTIQVQIPVAVTTRRW